MQMVCNHKFISKLKFNYSDVIQVKWKKKIRIVIFKNQLEAP